MDEPVPIPDEVLALLHDHVDSIEGLETLLALHRSPDVAHSDADLAQALRIPVPLAAAAAAGLREAGLARLDPAGGTRFAPRSESLLDAVEDLAACYEEDRAMILAAMTRHALERIRRSAADAFADAFRIQKKRRKDPDA